MFKYPSGSGRVRWRGRRGGGSPAFGPSIDWRSSWGVDPADDGRILPGDDLVAVPSHSETRGIDDRCAAVRPSGRGSSRWATDAAGWYSYDQLDMKGRSADDDHSRAASHSRSATSCPTFPGGGFEVRVVDRGRALAVYTDSAITTAQAEAFAASQATVPLGLQASGSFMRTTPPDFAASWTFVARPAPRRPDPADRAGARLVRRRARRCRRAPARPSGSASS